MTTVTNILEAARSCLDTPFQHQGRLKGIALDCAGLLVSVAKDIDADYIDQNGYSRSPSQGLLSAALDSQPCLEKIEDRNDRKPGDLLLMRFDREPQHLAVCAGETIIHSYQAVGKVCEHRLADVWVARIMGVYRFKGLTNE